jgi:hypothetical protein
MEKRYTRVEEQVEYGLNEITKERTVEVPLRDLLFVHQTLGLFLNFFHQPAHYPDLEAVHHFLGNSEAGAVRLLSESYYQKLRDVWPEDIVKGFDEGRFDNPDPPYYYRSAAPGPA